MPISKLITLPKYSDENGVLTCIEGMKDFPYEIKRVFFLTESKGLRGSHAHRETNQLLFVTSGELCIRLHDGEQEQTFMLNSPYEGILIPKMTYIEMDSFSQDAVAVVLADTHYDPHGSIQNKSEFLRIFKGKDSENESI